MGFKFHSKHHQCEKSLKNIIMENVKEIQNDPDKRKKALKSTTCSDVIQLALHITMVVIGVQYKDDCTFPVPQYLMWGGGICLVFTILRIIAVLTPSECDDKFVVIISPLTSFCVALHNFMGIGCCIWTCWSSC